MQIPSDFIRYFGTDIAYGPDCEPLDDHDKVQMLQSDGFVTDPMAAGIMQMISNAHDNDSYAVPIYPIAYKLA